MSTTIENVQISPVNIKDRQDLGLKPGDTVKVHQKIQDKGKTRIQVFDGLVLATKHGKEPGATFTVRKISNGIGVEKIFPLYSPLIDKIEIVKRAKVRRAKLYYIRDKVARQIRRQMRRMSLVNIGTESSAEAAARIEAEEKAALEAEEAEKKAREEAEVKEPKNSEEKVVSEIHTQEQDIANESNDADKVENSKKADIKETEVKDDIKTETADSDDKKEEDKKV